MNNFPKDPISFFKQEVQFPKGVDVLVILNPFKLKGSWYKIRSMIYTDTKLCSASKQFPKHFGISHMIFTLH